MYRKILVPLDGSEESQLALSRADYMCSQVAQGELIILRVVELVGLSNSNSYAIIRALEEQEAECDSYLKEVSAGLKTSNVVTLCLKGSRPAEIISQQAKERDVDLIVMTCHGRSAFHEFMVGSQTTSTLRQAPCSVLVVRDSPIERVPGKPREIDG
jgi:nucleotide-binding universal stress UspA family protein